MNFMMVNFRIKPIINFILISFFLITGCIESIKNHKNSIVKAKQTTITGTKYYTLEYFDSIPLLGNNIITNRYQIHNVYVLESDFYYEVGDTIK